MTKLCYILLVLVLSFSTNSYAQDSDSSTYTISDFMVDMRHLNGAASKYNNLMFTSDNNKRRLNLRASIYSEGLLMIERYNTHFNELKRNKLDKDVLEQIKTIQKETGIEIYKSIKNGKRFSERMNGPKNSYIEANTMDSAKYSLSAPGEVRALKGPITWTKVKLNSAQRAKNFTKTFGQQFRDFNIAGLLLGLHNTNTLENPLGVDQAIDALTDPIGAASFAAFVWGNHHATAALNKVKFIPPQLAHFGGMGAGMILSSVMHELILDLTDGDAAKCREAKDADNEHCRIFYERWFTKDKYVGYLPEVISLGLAAQGSAMITKPLMQGIPMLKSRVNGQFSPEAKQKMKRAKHNAKKMSLKILPRKKAISVLKALRVAGSFSYAGIIINVGNFVIFMKLHHDVAPYVNAVWKPLNLNYLGWSLDEELKKDKAQRGADFVRVKKVSDREINELDKNLEKIGYYSSDANYKKCIDNSDRNKNGQSKLVADIIAGDNTFRTDYDKISLEKCNRKFSPELVINNDYAFNKAEDRNTLADFTTKQMNWQMLIGNFSEVYEISRSVYKRILDLKNHSDLSTEEILKTELSKEGLRTFVAQLRSSDVESDGTAKPYADDNSEGLYEDLIKGTTLGHLADYIIYSMACGPSLADDLTITRSKDNFTNTADIKVVNTPFGSSLSFNPPKITNTSRKICLSLEKIYTEMNHHNKNLRYKDFDKIGFKSDVYHDFWVDENDKQYSSLVEYVFNNIDPKFTSFDNSETESFDWWSNNVHTQVQAVWDEYDHAYTKLIKEYLLPKLIDTKYGDTTVIDRSKKVNPRQTDKGYRNVAEKFKKTRIIEKTKNRLVNHVNRLVKLVDNSNIQGINRAEFDKHIDLFLQNTVAQLENHQRQLQSWNNTLNIYDSQDTEKRINEALIKMLNDAGASLAKSQNLVEFIYPNSIIQEVASAQCDDAKITTIMNQNRFIEMIHIDVFTMAKGGLEGDMSYYNCTTPNMNCELKTPEEHKNLKYSNLKDQGYRALTCADKKYAQQMLTRANNETFYQNLISAQLKVTKTELVDYLQLIINLTNTIGYKTEGE